MEHCLSGSRLSFGFGWRGTFDGPVMGSVILGPISIEQNIQLEMKFLDSLLNDNPNWARSPLNGVQKMIATDL